MWGSGRGWAYRCIGAEIEEELRENVEREEPLFAEVVVGEANHHKDDGQEDKAHHLNGLAADCVNGCDSHPISRDGACTDEDEIADGRVVEDVVHVRTPGIANGGEDDRVIQTQAVECHIEEEPRACCS